MVVQMKLKGKYRSAKRSTYKGGENFAPKKHRNKTGSAKHNAMFGEPVVRVLVVDGKTGKSHMENY